MVDEPSKKAEVAVELETLKEDIQKLQGDLKEMFHTLGSQGKEKLEESRKKLQAAIKSLKGEAEEKFHETYGSLREHGKEALEKSRKQIEERPLTAVLVAFIAGIIFDRLIDRR